MSGLKLGPGDITRVLVDTCTLTSEGLHSNWGADKQMGKYIRGKVL